MLTPSERSTLLDRYAAGADTLVAAWRDLPPAARAWRPAPGEWSAHEVLCHAADVEANFYARIRFLVAESHPTIRAFDENQWATAGDYHAQPAESALAVLQTLRAHTTSLVRRLPDEAWERAGTHTEMGRYTAEQWLRGQAAHLEDHAKQIESNQNHWWAAGAPLSKATPGAPARNDARRADLIEQYAAGAARLRGAWTAVPREAIHWRPKPGEWSAHEVICHTADSETNAYTRIRFLLAEDAPVIQGYDENHWATALDYASQSAEDALAAVEAVRAHTTSLIRALPETAWRRAGTHSESGPYAADDWLRVYADHLEGHARQIEANVAAYAKAHGSR
jgi:uncharacterized damage-inducible protein DinB